MKVHELNLWYNSICMGCWISSFQMNFQPHVNASSLIYGLNEVYKGYFCVAKFNALIDFVCVQEVW